MRIIVEKRKRANRRAIKREGLVEERNRREGNARILGRILPKEIDFSLQ